MITGWIILGIVLSALELLLPGAVVIFLGLGAITTAGLIYLGVVEGWTQAFLSWFMISIFYLIVLRTLLMKLMPGEEKVENTDEDADAAGKIVHVVEAIRPEAPGRISLQDSTWEAHSSSIIEAGDKAIIVSRKNLGWIVKPVD
jgi:membrane protein implicated in regulation of membrane protease activity